MNEDLKKFLYNLAIVLISSALSFALSYVSQLKGGLDSGAVGGGLSYLGIKLRDRIIRV